MMRTKCKWGYTSEECKAFVNGKCTAILCLHGCDERELGEDF